ncbi:MAG: hypothetical protein AABY22_09340 [Nanoarchaeota archaeon]
MFKIICKDKDKRTTHKTFFSEGPLKITTSPAFQYSEYTGEEATAEIDAPPHTISIFDYDGEVEITWEDRG